jgi:hypothetical protein
MKQNTSQAIIGLFTFRQANTVLTTNGRGKHYCRRPELLINPDPGFLNWKQPYTRAPLIEKSHQGFIPDPFLFSESARLVKTASRRL